MDKNLSNAPFYSIWWQNAASLSLFENDKFFENRRKKSIQRRNPKSISAPYHSYQKPKGNCCKKLENFFFEKLSIELFQRTLTRSHTIKTHCYSLFCAFGTNAQILGKKTAPFNPFRPSRSPSTFVLPSIIWVPGWV